MRCFNARLVISSAKMLRMFYIAYIRAKIDYGCVVYGNTNEKYLEKLEIVQNIALRLILGARNTTPILSLQSESFIPSLKTHRDYLKVKQYLNLRHKWKEHPTNVLLNIEHNEAPQRYPNTFVERVHEHMVKLHMPTIRRRPEESGCCQPRFDLRKVVKFRP